MRPTLRPAYGFAIPQERDPARLSSDRSVVPPERLRGVPRWRDAFPATSLAFMDGRSHDVLRCDHCGQVIGVYEPATILVEGIARETSLAAEPALASHPGPHYHRSCFEASDAILRA
jgi:hypothetical protein